jgi:hypothetical protein
MSRLIKIVSLLTLITIGLAACGGQTAAPTQDINAVYTQAAETAYAQLTQIAGAATATIAPTETATQISTIETPLGTVTMIVSDTPGPSPTFSLFPTSTLGFSLTPQASVTPIPPFGTPSDNCYNAAYISDITIPDYTELNQDDGFQKIWRLKNTGTCIWDEGFGLVFVGGALQGGLQQVYISKKEDFVNPGEEENFAFDMIAQWTKDCKVTADNPKGACISHYRMISDKGYYFGQSVTLVIIVKK